jgi:hypothetical protein
MSEELKVTLDQEDQDTYLKILIINPPTRN